MYSTRYDNGISDRVRGGTGHTARFLYLVDLAVNGDYGVDVIVRRTDEGKLRFKA